LQRTEEISSETSHASVGTPDFEEVVLKSEQPVIVDFTADWCPPCRVLAPVYAALGQEYTGKVRFTSLNIDANPEISARYGVQGVPTLIIFAQGQEVTRLVGPHPSRLRMTIERQLAEHSLL
jgi:thioredoxin 1